MKCFDTVIFSTSLKTVTCTCDYRRNNGMRELNISLFTQPTGARHSSNHTSDGYMLSKYLHYCVENMPEIFYQP